MYVHSYADFAYWHSLYTKKRKKFNDRTYIHRHLLYNNQHQVNISRLIRFQAAFWLEATQQSTIRAVGFALLGRKNHNNNKKNHSIRTQLWGVELAAAANSTVSQLLLLWLLVLQVIANWRFRLSFSLMGLPKKK